MNVNLINFLEELETKGLFKSKVGEFDEKFKKLVDSLNISIEEKQELETLFNKAVEVSKNEFLEIGFLYCKEKNKKYGS
jgi:hypothetical protein